MAKDPAKIQFPHLSSKQTSTPTKNVSMQIWPNKLGTKRRPQEAESLEGYLNLQLYSISF